MKKNNNLFIALALGVAACSGLSCGNQEQLMLYLKMFGSQPIANDKREKHHIPEFIQNIGRDTSKAFWLIKKRVIEWTRKNKVTIALGMLAISIVVYNQVHVLQSLNSFIQQQQKLQELVDRQQMNIINNDSIEQLSDVAEKAQGEVLQGISDKELGKVNASSNTYIEQSVQLEIQDHASIESIEENVEFLKIRNEELDKLAVLAKLYEETRIKANYNRKRRFLAPHEVSSIEKKQSERTADLAEREFFKMLNDLHNGGKISSEKRDLLIQQSQERIKNGLSVS